MRTLQVVQAVSYLITAFTYILQQHFDLLSVVFDFFFLPRHFFEICYGPGTKLCASQPL
jgi:hypothetical protein